MGDIAVPDSDDDLDEPQPPKQETTKQPQAPPEKDWTPEQETSTQLQAPPEKDWSPEQEQTIKQCLAYLRQAPDMEKALKVMRNPQSGVPVEIVDVAAGRFSLERAT